ncbi:hypothetical protein, partial [Coleofasciculus sp. F4-SAH-05]|uniref:hypothetical protein n=1 Tax=Coleofasciculus sp. F4-SAH-05 TaxID=3069525 RepID=UPI0032F78A52
RQAHQPGSGSTGSPTRQWFDRLTNQAVVRQAHQPGSGSTGSPTRQKVKIKVARQGKVKENDECLDKQEIRSHCASTSLVLSPNI